MKKIFYLMTFVIMASLTSCQSSETINGEEKELSFTTDAIVEKAKELSERGKPGETVQSSDGYMVSVSVYEDHYKFRLDGIIITYDQGKLIYGSDGKSKFEANKDVVRTYRSKTQGGFVVIYNSKGEEQKRVITVDQRLFEFISKINQSVRGKSFN